MTLVTTLLNADVYTPHELAQAYRLRWTVETSFRHIKTTMKMDVLHCRTVDGVLKELTMFVLTYNLVRMTMLEAAKRQQVEPDRISFVDALRWLRNAQPGDELPKLNVNPKPNRSSRTAHPQASPEIIPTDDSTPRTIETTPNSEKHCGLIGWHSPLTPFIPLLSLDGKLLFLPEENAQTAAISPGHALEETLKRRAGEAKRSNSHEPTIGS